MAGTRTNIIVASRARGDVISAVGSGRTARARSKTRGASVDNFWTDNEEERKEKITAFYDKNPDGFACDYCVKEISREQVERSCELTGFRMCGICLALYITRGQKDD